MCSNAAAYDLQSTINSRLIRLWEWGRLTDEGLMACLNGEPLHKWLIDTPEMIANNKLKSLGRMMEGRL